MSKCWEKRGCPKEMETGCAFAKADTYCELNCEFLFCPKGRPEFALTLTQLYGMDPTEYNVKKEGCLFCEVFLSYARQNQHMPDSKKK